MAQATMTAAASSGLRQKMWGVFIRPYQTLKGENIAYRDPLYVRSLQVAAGYTEALGGEGWMLYRKSTSFVLVREIVKQVMDDLGFSKNDILVTEIVPTDHVVTPLA